MLCFSHQSYDLVLPDLYLFQVPWLSVAKVCMILHSVLIRTVWEVKVAQDI